jgi:hypothetical protein
LGILELTQEGGVLLGPDAHSKTGGFKDVVRALTTEFVWISWQRLGHPKTVKVQTQM